MPITIGANIASLKAQQRLGKNTGELASVYERLSSGQRINHASDDAAGLSIASRLSADARVFLQGIRNVNDGISVANVAEGALNALKDISQRQLELATEAANGTYSLQQRRALNTEANTLVAEFNRIVGSTTFNGRNVLDPSLQSIVVQAGYGTGGILELGVTDSLRRAVGNGTFQTARSFSDGGVGPEDIAVGDLNGDGKVDFVTTGYGSGVDRTSIFISNGDGSFRAVKTINDSGIEPRLVELGDVNGDGNLDIVISEVYDKRIGVMLGTGQGTFGGEQVFQTGPATPSSLSLGDTNGDGKLDAILTFSGGTTAAVLLGNGNGTFGAARSYQTGVTNSDFAIVGDFNGDERLDILTRNSTGSAALLIGAGNGSFQAAASFSTSGNLSKIISGDFNGDGVLDFAGVDTGAGTLNLYIGNGNGTFKAGVSYADSAGVNCFSLASGDINGDGRIDIIADAQGGSGIDVFFGNGDGTFLTPIKNQKTSSVTLAVALGDFNSDGRLDIIDTDYNLKTASILIGNGAYTTDSQYLNICTKQGALDALSAIRANLDRIQGQLGAIGATTSRFGTALATLQGSRENYLAAAGRIMDADVASESSELVRKQILQQAASSVLAQANQQPMLALLLLKGG